MKLMKVARKKRTFLSTLVVGGLCFGATYFLTQDSVKPTFAKVEATLEETKIMQTIEKVTKTEETPEPVEKESTKKEQEIKKVTDDIKKQLEKNKEDRRKLEQELEKDRELSKNVDEAKRRLAELEQEYAQSLKNASDEETLDNIDEQGHCDTECSSKE